MTRTAESTDAPPRIRRFTAPQRLLHLALAASFAVMLWTGLCLWSPALATIMSRPAAKRWHLIAAIALGVAFAAITAVRPRDVRALAREVDGFDRDDVAWLKGGPRRVLDHASAPEQGWLNAGQKLNTAITMGLMLVLAGTGLLLWLGERNTSFRLAGTVDVHDVATVVLVLLVAGHLYLAVLHPQTRKALRGMATGDVERDWARAHHAKWVRETESGSTDRP